VTADRPQHWRPRVPLPSLRFRKESGITTHNLKQNRSHQPGEQPAALLHPPFDVELAWASHDLDAAADFAWFEGHPGATERVRPASALELVAFKLPAGTEMLVFRAPGGLQGRMILLPEED